MLTTRHEKRVWGKGEIEKGGSNRRVGREEREGRDRYYFEFYVKIKR